MHELNLQIFDWLNDKHDALEPLLWIASNGAELGVLLMAWVVFRQAKDRWFGVFIVAAAVFASGLAHALADQFGMPRPYALGLSEAHIPHGGRPGFPSAHATVMFTAALLLWQRPALRVAAGCMTALALLTTLGRVHAGVHFPFDIGAGLLLAAAIAATAFLSLRGWPMLRQWRTATSRSA